MQLALFTILFAILWSRFELLGAVLARGISLLIANAPLLVIAKCNVPFRFSAGRDYGKFVLLAVGASAVALGLMPLGLVGVLPIWAFMGAFLLVARYRWTECGHLLRCFVPTSFSKRIRCEGES